MALEAAIDRGRGPVTGASPRPGPLSLTLPAAVTPLIGRNQEVATLLSQLRQSEARCSP